MGNRASGGREQHRPAAPPAPPVAHAPPPGQYQYPGQHMQPHFSVMPQLRMHPHMQQHFLPPPQQQPQQQQQQPFFAPSMQSEVATFRNHANLNKQTLAVSIADGQLVLSFEVDVSAPTTAQLYASCTEVADSSSYSLRSAAGAPAPVKCPVEEGSGVTVQMPPLLLGGSSSQSLTLALWHDNDGVQQCQVTVFSVASPAGESATATVLSQKFARGADVYLLEDLFGLEEQPVMAELAADDCGDDDSKLCVICICEERDTACMPCRHMCLCSTCAAALSKESDKCPVCRRPIDSLLKLRRQTSPSPSPTPSDG
eukprot:TRINITY_DN2770_c5_g1_i1.p2 TRINITY_DN2770_c5_g1~~TRINITY_DN2770_c5_g1_i1.p2  ORF type:complete len:313 (+),score=72.92 TRINITY_DN2770_c5_g1_i1:73-1011(+)